MSKGETLRALVTERLTAAAEEIFALVERTIAEYEEELCRSKEENQRRQQRLDQALSPQLMDAEVQTATPESVSALAQKTTHPFEVKVEPVLPECTAVCVKSEEPEPVAPHLEAETHEQMGSLNDRNSLAQPMETAPDGHLYNHKRNLRQRLKVQGGEKPFSCSAHTNGFMRKANVRKYLQTRPGETPFSCSVCAKTFKLEDYLKRHMSTHATQNVLGFTYENNPRNHEKARERPFSCSECNARFRRRVNLNRHLTVHREKSSQR